MQLEHLNLVVRDIEETLDFYRAAFPHWRVRGEGADQWYGKARRWCHFGDDNQYLTFNDNGEGENRELQGHQVGLAHFAYITDNLDALVERLRGAGFELSSEGSEHTHRRNKYFTDPAGFEIEFVQYFSDNPEQRNLYL